MIRITHHSDRYLALHGAYEHRAAIKALSDYPDVKWDGEARAWLVDNRMWPQLVQALGPHIAPLPVEFWCDFQEYAPPSVQPRRRSKREVLAQKAQDAEAAGRFGAAVVGLMHEEAGR